MDSATSFGTSLDPLSTSRSLTSTAATPLPQSNELTFAGVEDLFTKIYTMLGDSLIVRNVSRHDLDRISSAREQKQRKFRLSLYLAESELLFITIPTITHENLHAMLDDLILGLVCRMNLLTELSPVHATTYSQRDHSGNLRSRGEGDSCRKPISQRGHGDDFPTLVIEGGYTQTWPSLRVKGRWWFEASNYAVKIVLLVKMDQSFKNICIEKWKAVEEECTRPGATTTRAMAAQVQGPPNLIPTCIHTIDIKQVPGIGPHDPRRSHPSSYTVSSGLLRLEFRDLFLREPLQGEDDIILGTTELQAYAARVWRPS